MSEMAAPSDGVNARQEQDENAIPAPVNPPVPEPEGGDQEEVLLTTGPDDTEEEDDGLEEESDDVSSGDGEPGEDPPTNEPAEG